MKTKRIRGTTWIRGGAWFSYDDGDARCAYRGRLSPGDRDNGVSFRVVSPPISVNDKRKVKNEI
jgi:formylglycine-generating enzyme required for sulfatase activity